MITIIRIRKKNDLSKMGESLGLDSWEHLKLNIHNINSFLIQTNIDSTFKLTKSKWILLCLI
jgi:hypothetical protein